VKTQEKFPKVNSHTRRYQQQQLRDEPTVHYGVGHLGVKFDSRSDIRIKKQKNKSKQRNNNKSSSLCIIHGKNNDNRTDLSCLGLGVNVRRARI